MIYNGVVNERRLCVLKRIMLVLGLLSTTYVSYGQEGISLDKTTPITQDRTAWRRIELNKEQPSSLSNPLILVNGKAVSNYEGLNPKFIMSLIRIKPGDPKLATYGPNGMNGVVLIETDDSLKK